MNVTCLRHITGSVAKHLHWKCGRTAVLPIPRPSGPALRFVVAGLLVRDGLVLICQRRPDQPMALQWEFPGGKIEQGESPEQALARELQEELGIAANIGSRGHPHPP